MIGSPCCGAASRIRPATYRPTPRPAAARPAYRSRSRGSASVRSSGGRSRIASQTSCRAARRVLAAAVADDPGDGIAEVEFPDLLAECLDRLRKPTLARRRRRRCFLRALAIAGSPGNRASSCLLFLGCSLRPRCFLMRVAGQHDVDASSSTAAPHSSPGLPRAWSCSATSRGWTSLRQPCFQSRGCLTSRLVPSAGERRQSQGVGVDVIASQLRRTDLPLLGQPQSAMCLATSFQNVAASSTRPPADALRPGQQTWVAW